MYTHHSICKDTSTATSYNAQIWIGFLLFTIGVFAAASLAAFTSIRALSDIYEIRVPRRTRKTIQLLLAFAVTYHYALTANQTASMAEQECLDAKAGAYNDGLDVVGFRRMATCVGFAVLMGVFWVGVRVVKVVIPREKGDVEIEKQGKEGVVEYGVDKAEE